MANFSRAKGNVTKTVVITGTSTGIGKACVERMAADGWTVYAGVRKEADADRLSRDLAGDVRPVLIDVTDASRISELIGRCRPISGWAASMGWSTTRA